jgi:hypothetical protein
MSIMKNKTSNHPALLEPLHSEVSTEPEIFPSKEARLISRLESTRATLPPATMSVCPSFLPVLTPRNRTRLNKLGDGTQQALTTPIELSS